MQELGSAFWQIDCLWQEVVSSHPEVFGAAYQTFVKREGQLFLSGRVRQHVTGKIDRVLRRGAPEDSVKRLDNSFHQIVNRWRMYLATVENQTGQIPLEDFLSYNVFPERHRILALQLMRMEKVDFLDFQRIAALTENLLELSRNALGLK